MNRAPRRLASTPADLFANIHEQSERVLGKAAGFYVVTSDPARDRVRLAYLVLNGTVQTRSLYCTIAECDAMRERSTLINDAFSKRLAGDVVNSISVPMVRNGVVVGAFGALAHEARAYDARDASALAAIAELGALALENLQFVARLEKARREADRLEEIGRAMTASLSLTDVLRTVVDAAVELSEADAAAVWLLRDQDEMEAAMTAGELAPERGLVVPVPPMLRRPLAAERRVFVYEDVKTGLHETPAHLRHLSAARSTMAVPLIAGENVLGALSLGHKERRRYSADDIRLVERLSYQAAIAVANARLHEQIIGLSLTDPLSGLPNRRHLEICLEKEFEAARRGRTLSVILFDLDNFKSYNDSAGHQAGDEALHAFADVLRSETRAMNLAARYGGDEFLTVLAEIDRAGALIHAQRVADAVERHPLLSAANIRASAGVGTYNPGMARPADLICAADADLYARKAIRRVIPI
ncbi:MAG TPA: sensor domain-containing diguanylate cyclase [Longimicrobiales bacterium]